jgi:hypothetical protein
MVEFESEIGMIAPSPGDTAARRRSSAFSLPHGHRDLDLARLCPYSSPVPEMDAILNPRDRHCRRCWGCERNFRHVSAL